MKEGIGKDAFGNRLNAFESRLHAFAFFPNPVFHQKVTYDHRLVPVEVLLGAVRLVSLPFAPRRTKCARVFFSAFFLASASEANRAGYSAMICRLVRHSFRDQSKTIFRSHSISVCTCDSAYRSYPGLLGRGAW